MDRKPIDYFFELLFVCMPLVVAVVRTLAVVRADFDYRFVKDPGHIMIRRYDALVIVSTITIIVLVTYITLTQSPGVITPDTFIVWLLFPWGISVYAGALLTLNSLLLGYYGKKRHGIIESVNQKAGWW